ncbi:MAG: TonB-dependent receptor plug domain-containing protein, partial [Bacteroidales bacterium]|nr:TonB-dependent receptor plug domain-containing protein [Bacteroidales bacterium]
MIKKIRFTISLILISGLVLALNLNTFAQDKPSENTSYQKVKLKDAVKILQKTFSVSITTDGSLAKSEVLVSIEDLKDQKDIKSALDLLVKDLPLSYIKMRDDYYVIGKKDTNGQSMIQLDQLNNTKKTLTGVVKFNSDGSTIPGATILVKGTNNGVVTDLDGKFSIEVNPKATNIIVSFLGMKTQELSIDDAKAYNINLEEDAFGLDEVVVSGVASATPRKNLTISVSKVNDDVLKEAHSSSAASTLQGKVAGVTVVQAGGLPGSGAAIRLRGSTSLNGANAPLVIMDGIIMNTGLSDINIDDIESMEVVKGAAASALYGSRAGNGVIVITTKRGNRNKEGVTTVNIRQELGSQAIPKYIEQATHHPYQLAEDNGDFNYTRYEGVLYDPDGNVIAGNRKLTESGYATQEYAKLYEHQKDFFKKGFYNSTYVSVMGNSAKTNFSLSYEYNKQEGVLISTDGYQRNNFRINLDHKITDKLKISTSNLVVLTKDNNPGSYNSFSDLLFVSPDVDLYAPNEDGTPYKIIPDPW